MVGAVYVVGILPLMESLNLLCVDMNALELADELENTYPFVGVMEIAATMLRQQQAEIEKLRSWVEMLVEVPFFNEIDHYRGIPVSILRKAQE